MNITTFEEKEFESEFESKKNDLLNKSIYYKGPKIYPETDYHNSCPPAPKKKYPKFINSTHSNNLDSIRVNLFGNSETDANFHTPININKNIKMPLTPIKNSKLNNNMFFNEVIQKNSNDGLIGVKRKLFF